MTGHDHAAGQGRAGLAGDADRRWLTAALALIVTFMAGEVSVGIIAGSLALLSDAAHMLTDAVAIALALTAVRLAARPAAGGYTYGLKRAEILSAQANGITLLVLSVWLGYEAIRRLISPPHVAGALVVITAVAGIAVNLAATWCISRANRSSLNVQGAYRHILTDLFGFIATAIAGAVILTAGFDRADPLASLVIVALMIKAGTDLVRDSGRIFLEAAPPGLSPDEIGGLMTRTPQVTEVHDLHIWLITSGEPALSAHVLVAPGGDCHHVQHQLRDELREAYGITHATLQVDHVREAAPGPLPITARPGSTPSPGTENTHGPVHRPAPRQH
jgi:cobalt-zinc-cadmium efflux system protein